MQINHKLSYFSTKSFSKKILRTEVKPIQNKIIEGAPIKIDMEKMKLLEKVTKNYNKIYFFKNITRLF